MRHISLALAILAACLGLCIFSCVYVRHGAAQALEALDRTNQIYWDQSPEAAAKEAEDLQALWEHYVPRFGMMLSHEQTDEIEQQLSSLHQYAVTADDDEFASVYAQTRFLLEHLRLMQLPTIYNIL